MKVVEDHKNANIPVYPGVTLAAKQKVKERDYWLNKLSGELVKSCFPPDYPGNKNKKRTGTIKYRFPPACLSSLINVIGGSDLKMHIIMAAAVVVLLHKYTGNDDIIIGTPVYKQETGNDFINTALVLRNDVKKDMTFRELLLEIKQTIVEAAENRNYPLEILAKQLNRSYSPDENFPLFDVAVSVENIQDKRYLQHINTNMTFSFLRTGRDVEGIVEYNGGIYEETTIKRITAHLTRLLQAILVDLELKLSQIDFLSSQEKRQILFDFNDTGVEYPGDHTIHQLYEEQVEKIPDHIAVVDTQTNVFITYSELNEKANQLAGCLLFKGLKAEEAVGVMADASVEMILGVLAALKAGGAYLPVNPGYPGRRKKYLLKDGQVIFLLTNCKDGGDYAREVIQLEGWPIFKPTGNNDFGTDNGCGKLAYIIYTSGSTGKPKGVLVEHRNVVRLVKNTNYLEFRQQDRLLQTGALEFDASTFEIWGALLNGLALHLAPKNIILTPVKLKDTLYRHYISTIWMTSPLFNEMVDADVEIFRHLRNLLVGGDVLSPTHIDQLKRRFPHLNIINGYGPTENTTFSTTYLIDKEYHRNIPIGKPIANSTAYIVDKYNHAAPIGAEGELVVGGDGIARGYLNNPELTAEKFVISHLSLVNGQSLILPMTNDQCPMTFYRTGDLARWLPDGNIEFGGRIDQQVKIRGFRIELAEIKNRLLEYGQIRETMVITREDAQGEKYICAYLVTEGDVDISALKKFLSKYLPGYMIPSYFMQIEKIPLTLNGKVDRKALPSPVVRATGKYEAPGNTVEKTLVRLWAQVLNRDDGTIGIDDNFFELGGHSLKATILVSKVQKALSVQLPLAEVFRTPTIRELAQYIKKAEEDKFVSIEPAEKKDYYALSSAQERLYILQQMELNNTVYNIPQVIPLPGKPDIKRLEETFIKLIQRHESLRTSFHMVKNEPVQKVQDAHAVDFKIEYYEISSDRKGMEEIVKVFEQPFDLGRAPLVKEGVIKTGEGKYVLVVVVHHIISDGMSHVVLAREFNTLYNGETLPPLRIQYKDFAQWQNSEGEKERMKQQESYWLKAFAGEIPVLHLPFDFPRPMIQRFEGSTVNFEISVKETQTLRGYIHEEGATLYMMLLAVTTVLLSKLSRQEDIIVGTPAAGRRHADLEQVIGMFVNTLAMRSFPGGEKTFKAFLSEVTGRSLEAFENQEYQFEDLVEKVAVNRDASRNPLFDVLFAVQNMGENAADPDDRPEVTPSLPDPDAGDSVREQETQALRVNIAKFDISITAVEKRENIAFGFTYASGLFKRETINRFARYFKRIITGVLEDDEKRLSDIEILSLQEKEQLLCDFNDTKIEYPQGSTLHRLFEEQARRTPDSTACHRAYRTYMTYNKLNQRSDQLACVLRERGVQPDTRGSIVGIMVGRSIEMIIGLLAILKAGGAYLPIDPEYPPERIKYMLEDSGVGILVSKVSEVSRVSRDCDVIDLDGIGKEDLKFPTHPLTHSPAQLCYIMYTSGSTGRPKGVMVQHANAVNVVCWFGRSYLRQRSTHVLMMSDYTFDPSVNQVFGSLLHGAVLHIVDKELILDREGLRRYIDMQQIHVVNFVPTLFKELLGKGEKLASIRVVLSGAERLDDAVKDSIIEKGYVLYNQYGPTETTIDALVDKCSKEEKVTLGPPISNVSCYILDKHNHPVPVGIVGELYVGGAGVTRGYLNNPELTAEKFNRSYKSYRTYNSYRTGDLARWLENGKVEFLGRMDSQTKIGGYRVEPGEIETQLLKHQAIKDAVVLAREKYLCAYIVPGKETTGSLTPLELREFLSGELPGYMIPSHFVIIDEIPLTPNGKVDRKALPVPGIEIGAGYVAPRSVLEEHLTGIWSGVLEIDKDKIGIDHNFFQLGGHSLKAVVMIARIHKEFSVKLPLAEVFKTPTIRGAAEYIKKAAEDRYRAIEPAEKKEYYALSSAQKRLYLIQQMVPGDTVYNMPKIVELQEAPDTALLEKAFKQLIRRHESLRTSFHMLDDQPVQRIHDDAAFSLEHAAWSMEGGDFVRPFDLSRAPLLRARVIKVGEEKYVLLVDMHHVISDGISTGILTRDFISLYMGETLPPLRLHYKDYCQWQNSDKEREIIKRQEEYWLKEFKGENPVLNMPTDFPRPVIQSFEGTSTGFEVGTDETRALKDMASERGATLYMVLLAVYNVFLSKVTGQEDIVVGTPVAGRRHADMEKIIGMFVNTLALRNYPHGEKPFTDFLSSIREKTVQAFENQEYPFEDLVEKASVNRETSRNPLFDVMFAFQNIADRRGSEKKIPKENTIVEPGLPAEMDTPGIRTAKFDFTLVGSEAAARENLVFIVEYCTKLFKKSTIQRFIAYFNTIISSVVKEPHIPLAQVEFLSPGEKQQILQDFNDAGQEYPTGKSIHELFAEQAGRTPDAIALHGTHRTYRTYMTYKELQQKSNQLAHMLREKNVQPGTFVAIKTERSLEMIVGILGTLKAGGAYVPLNPKAPEARIKYILRECSVKILLSNVSQVSEDIEVIDLIEILGNIGPIGPIGPIKHRSPTHLCYVIFTSGSTGNPKGVPITHSNLSPLLHWGYELGMGVEDRTLQNLAYYFDWSVWEIFITLTSGACLYVVPDEVLLNPGACIDFMNKHRVTVLHVTPTQYRYFARTNQKTGTLKYLFIGAEKLDADLVKRSFELVRPGCRVFNMYGPTEATIISAVLEIQRTGFEELESLSSVPIGCTMANARLLVLNRYLKLCPVNTGGELYIAGDGVAAGYLNDPEKTCKSFIKNIYETRGIKGKWLYRTGDLVRWLPNPAAQGAYSIEFFGRIDHQVKIRGHRIELGEIEKHLLEHANVKEAVVIALELGKEISDKYLCAYFVPHPAAAAAELKEYLARSLPDYMIPAYFTPIEKIPLTPNGKIDRKALPAPGIGPTQAYAAPGNEVEKILAQLWTEVLNIQAPIGIDDNFFDLGGHSLKATSLVSRIHKTLDVKLPLTLIFTSPTIRELAGDIMAAARDTYISVDPVEKKDYYVLSPAQKRLYIIYQMVPLTTSYNMPETIPLDGEPEIEKLEQAFKKLIARHESLRTSFQLIDGQPVQRVHEDVAFEIEYFDLLTDGDDSPRRGSIGSLRRRVRPFDLSRPPLLRVGLVKVEKNKYNLMLDMHHIISDGISRGILQRDFAALYREEALPPLKLQYKDYARWQMNKKNREALKQQEAYWLETFSGEIPVLDIATDYARPAVQRFDGETIHVNMGTAGTGNLNKLALEQGVTMFMVLTAVTNILLSKLSSQEDIIIGTPIAGRRHADLEKIIGMFINTLALRSYPMGEKSFAAFLGEVKAKTLAAFENQEYPFEELVDRAAVNRDTGRNPLFDVMLAFQNMGDTTAAPGTKDTGDTQHPSMPTPDRFESGIAKFDLTLIANESEENLYISFNYSTSLFKRETIRRFILYFKKIVSIVVEDPGKKLSEIEMITGEEKKRLLYDFNRRESDYPGQRTIQQLFRTRAEKVPDSVALNSMVPGEQRPVLTYRELNEKTDQLARVLKKKGLVGGAVAGIMTDRSTAMMVGIISILKAGGAYLPLNPQNPVKRTEYMLEDSSVELFLTHKKYGEPFGEKYHIIHLEDQALYEYHDGDKEVTMAEDTFNHLAYIIYTSGSTGNPKGVPVSHFNLSPLLHWGYRHLGIDSTDRVLQNLSYFFDWSVWEIFIALTTGASLHIAPGSLLLNPGAQVEVIDGNGITVLHITPTHFRYLANLEPGPELETLKYLFIGAEKLGHDLVQQGMEMVSEDCRVYNMYGPTEATIISNVLEIDKTGEGKYKELSSIPIGKPVGNTYLLVLDKNMKTCPLYAAGELYIGGDGVARGYLNNPELTSEKFDQDLWDYLDYQDNNQKLLRGGQEGGFLEKNPHGRRRQKLYKTGDLVRWLPDGNMEFLNRIDYQVKIRGYRIELAEIENQLAGHPGIAGVVVIDRESASGEKFLCAYIIPSAAVSSQPVNTLEPSGLKKYLSRLLPDYMIPSYFVTIEKIPLNPNGKIDRRALPGPQVTAGEEVIGPGNEIEEALVNIWSDVLSESRETIEIGIHDDFFQRGGHSLRATLLVSKIKRELAVTFPLVEVFQRSTVREQAEYIRYMKDSEEEIAALTDVEDENLVLLSEKTSKANHLFFVHDGSGEVEGYIEFCRRLTSKFDYWGIRADRWENTPPRNLTVEQLARKYIEKIRKIQTRGPYHICGWSIGGTIAFEMVRQLEQDHREVGFFALFDTTPPRTSLEREKAAGNNQINLQAMPRLIPNYHRLGKEELMVYLDRIRALDQARKNYIPGGKLITTAHFFSARQSPLSNVSIKRGWSDYFEKPLKIHRISGDHFSIFRMPRVRAFARTFDSMIDKYGQ